MGTTIFLAKKIVTMNPANPHAEAVAVRDGKVLGVGTVDELMVWDAAAEVDDRFVDKVLLPGFIEAHCHVMSGGMWTNPYVGFFDRRDPKGKTWAGCKNTADVIERLIEIDRQMVANGEPDDEILLAWGLDPIYFDEERLLAKQLDTVSQDRAIFVYHASGHLATANSAMLRRSNITADATTPGVSRDESGDPDGELQEPAAMSLAADAFTKIQRSFASPASLRNFAEEARNAGQTLVTDLGNGQLIDPEKYEQWKSTTAEPDFPVRAMVALSSMMMMGGPSDPTTVAAAVTELRSKANDKLRFGIVKLILDGSIQGFTARIGWPHYYSPPPGHPGNGIWVMPPDQLADELAIYHDAGLTVHVHCNGDEAAEVFIDAVEEVLERSPRWDHRHTVQHCQLTKRAQYRRMSALGMCANIFSNHIFYWGDQHAKLTVGPERARAMDACATAIDEGVSFSIHSDSPVTPLGPLHVAWCAVNRVTASGEVLGEDERISVYDALHAVTLGAAYQLKLDHEMGSIEGGKLADFAVLDDDPFSVPAMDLKSIGVWGTVLGGIPFPADG